MVIAPAHRDGKALFEGDYLEGLAMLIGLEFIYTLVTLKHRAAQRYFENHGYTLVGFMPGYDQEEVSPRVVEAAFVKCLGRPEAMLGPETSNIASTVRRRYEFMHEPALATGATQGR